MTELKEMGVVRPMKDVRAGSRDVELTPEWRPAAQSCPEKQYQPAEPANQPKVDRKALRAEICRLYDVGDCWAALRLAHENNIGVVMYSPPVVI